MDNTNTENRPAENPVPQPGAAANSGTEPNAQAEPANDPCRQQITVEIPAEEVAEQEQALVQQYSMQARVPGFRKGKVPAGVIRSRFAEQIREELLERLVPQYFRVAVMSSGHKPISAPSITDLQAPPGESIRFTASFDVMPEFELSDYKSIKVEKPNIQIGDEEVDAELKALQERQASFDPVNEDRPLSDGDFAQVSFTATPKEAEGDVQGGAEKKKDAKPIEPVKMDDVMVEIGSPTTVAQFSENLRGAKAGDEKDFEVAYSTDFHDRRLAGKSFAYHVKVTAIKKKALPELNDDFAKELSPEIETLDKLREMMRENLREQRQHEAEHEAKEKLMDTLISKHDFPVPHSMVEHHIGLRLERGLRALAAQGMRTEDMRRMDFRKLRAAQEPAAIKEAKGGMLLHRIADAENIQVSDEELNNEIASLAYHTQQTPEDVRKELGKDDGLERIRARLRGEKALDFLYSNAG
ncbi:MAG TPA: trigger factor [Candidatus Angelobacter sp.]|nr:trigger factor [Candidatus Angelobacter sp.]